jgi:hypothetical protein
MRFPPRRLGRPLALAAALSLSGAGCVSRPEMCSQSECGAQSSCVAGRCVGHGAVVAISAARRLVFPPRDVGCVRCGASHDGPPPLARLGSSGGPIVLLRFAIDLPPEASVVEAYIDLERVDEADADPAPVSLHAVRITSPWDERSLSWGDVPRLDDVGAPITRVRESAGPRVRVDVRDIVQRWRRRAGDEFGVAVVAESEGPTGIAFALRPSAAGAESAPSSTRAPELELYVK